MVAPILYSLFLHILVFCGCCEKSSQTGWLEATAIHSSQSLGVHMGESKVCVGTYSLWRLQKRIFPCCGSKLPMAGKFLGFLGLWPHHSKFWLCLRISFSSVSLMSRFELNYMCEDPFPNKPTSHRFQRVRCGRIFWGRAGKECHLNHNITPETQVRKNGKL